MLLITGATGTVGAHLLPLLQARGTPARLLTRYPAHLSHIAAPLEAARGSVDDIASVRDALSGVHTMLLLSPPNPFIGEWESAAVAAAAQAGVQHIVKISVGGTSPNSPVLLGRVHAAAEQALSNSGIAHTLLKPASFMQNIFASLPTVHTDGAIYNAHGTGRSTFIDAADVAAVVDACLADSAHAGKTYMHTGPEAVTFEQIAAALSQASGRSIQHVSIPGAAYAQALIGAGLPEWIARDLALLSEFVAQGVMADVSRDVETVLGRPGRTIADFAKQYGPMFS